MGNYTPNPFMTQPAHLPPLATAYKQTITLCFVKVKRESGWKKNEGKKEAENGLGLSI